MKLFCEIEAAPLNMSLLKSEAMKVYEKTPQISAGIRLILSKNILFQHLDDEQLTVVVNAFAPMEFR